MANLQPNSEPSESEKQPKMFSELMALWGELYSSNYSKEVTEATYTTWRLALSPLPNLNWLNKAFLLAMKESANYMPAVGVILEAYERIAEKESKTYFEPEPAMQTAAEDKLMWARLMAENKEFLKQPPWYEGKRWTKEDGWLPREESWRREAAREAQQKPVKSWHAPIKGPNIRP